MITTMTIKITTTIAMATTATTILQGDEVDDPLVTPMAGTTPPPEDFICPLSLELMTDPVIIASGQTFERSSIQAWLDQGNITCPKTNAPLPHLSLIPNFTVKALITAWCHANHYYKGNSSTSSTTASANSGGHVHLLNHSTIAGSEIQKDTLPMRSLAREASSGSCNCVRGLSCSSSVVSSNNDDSQFQALSEANRGVSQVWSVDGTSIRSTELSSHPSSAHGLWQNTPPGSRDGSGGGDNEWHNKSMEILPSESCDNSFSFFAKRLVGSLQHSKGIEEQRNAAAEIRRLTKSDTDTRDTFADAGAIQPLVDLLETEDSEAQEHSVTALLNLSINDNNKALLADAGAIPALVKVLKEGTPRSAENAAFALFTLSCVEENKLKIAAEGAIPPLVDLLVHGSLRGKKDAAIALYSLSSIEENKLPIVRAGVVKPLVDLMADSSSGMVEKSVAIVSNLVMSQEGRVALAEEGGIPVLVELIEMGTNKGKEIAALVLLQLCKNSTRHRAMVLQEGAIPPLVALSQTRNARAKETALTLLRHLREQRNNLTGSRPFHDD